MNPFAAKKLFQELTHAEVAFRINGEPHAAFLGRRRHQYRGEVRRELDRVVALGQNAGRLVDFFIKEFESEPCQRT